MTRPFFTPSPIIRQLVAKVITGQFQNTDMFYVMSNDVMSCHLAVVASQRLATRMSLILKSNTLRLLLCVVGYHLIDQSTDKYCPTSTFVVFCDQRRSMVIACLGMTYSKILHHLLKNITVVVVVVVHY